MEILCIDLSLISLVFFFLFLVLCKISRIKAVSDLSSVSVEVDVYDYLFFHGRISFRKG